MEDTHRSQFRLPHSLYEQLTSAAQQEGRSLNAEIVARLQRSFGFDGSGAVLSDQVERRLADLERRMAVIEGGGIKAKR